MQAVSFSSYGHVEIIDIPRPALRDPEDAIILVTTAAIGPWDIDRFLSIGDERVVPGGEFAGLVVEIGEAVTTIEIDDLVTNTVRHTNAAGNNDLFGSAALAGGHAEYVRVPHADQTLTKIAESGEERAVLAGGTVGLGVNAAAASLSGSPNGVYAVVGCDPIGMTALTALKHTSSEGRLLAVENHMARRTLAAGIASEAFSSSEMTTNQKADVVIVGSVREYPGFDAVTGLVKPGGRIIFAEPYGPGRVAEAGTKFPDGVTITAVEWPTNTDAKKIVTAMQIRRLDLTPLVSHVIPLDEVQDAYEAATEPGPGVQKVLLKP